MAVRPRAFYRVRLSNEEGTMFDVTADARNAMSETVHTNSSDAPRVKELVRSSTSAIAHSPCVRNTYLPTN